MGRHLEAHELDTLREHSRRSGGEAARGAPLGSEQPPEDRRPLAGLPLPRDVAAEDLSADQIAAISEAWFEGYGDAMSRRRAAGEPASDGPVLWWSPAVAGGWQAGWRQHDPLASGPSDRRVHGAAHLGAAADDQVVRDAAASADARRLDWRTARVDRSRGASHPEPSPR